MFSSHSSLSIIIRTLQIMLSKEATPKIYQPHNQIHNFIMPKINSQIRTRFYFIDSSLYKFIQPYRKFALFMKKAVITGLMCCDDVIQAPTMYTRPREQFSNRTESHSSNRITRPLQVATSQPCPCSTPSKSPI